MPWKTSLNICYLEISQTSWLDPVPPWELLDPMSSLSSERQEALLGQVSSLYDFLSSQTGHLAHFSSGGGCAPWSRKAPTKQNLQKAVLVPLLFSSLPWSTLESFNLSSLNFPHKNEEILLIQWCCLERTQYHTGNLTRSHEMWYLSSVICS